MLYIMDIAFFLTLKQACPIILIISGADVDLNILSPLFSFSRLPQAGTQISLADLPFSNEIFTLWYNLLPSKQMPSKTNEEEHEDSVFQPNQPLVEPIDLVSQNERRRSLPFNKLTRDRRPWCQRASFTRYPSFLPLPRGRKDNFPLFQVDRESLVSAHTSSHKHSLTWRRVALGDTNNLLT